MNTKLFLVEIVYLGHQGRISKWNRLVVAISKDEALEKIKGVYDGKEYVFEVTEVIR